MSREPRRVSELVGKVLEPVMARRAGMTLDLINAWPELAGDEFRKTTRPEKIDWPKRARSGEPFEPAVLVIACDAASALFFQHAMAPVLERVNVFFGFEAIKRIRIVQKPVLDRMDIAPRKNPGELHRDEEARLAKIIDDVEDPELKAVLEKLGRGIIARNR